MAEAATSRYESNYIKIAMVVLRVSPRAVRVQFDKEFHPDCLQRTLRSEWGCLSELKTKKRITKPQWNLLFPRTGRLLSLPSKVWETYCFCSVYYYYYYYQRRSCIYAVTPWRAHGQVKKKGNTIVEKMYCYF
jgi:hypothetical protein